MKYLRLTLLVIASALTVMRAQDEQENQKPPTEIPDFSNLDEYIYEPQSTVIFGFRHLSGPKMSFSGHGFINTPDLPGTDLTSVIARTYHDGVVGLDQRSTPRLDASGNPVIDPTSGVTLSDPITPDGKTNTWSYQDNSQRDNSPNGYIAFHSYSADVVDSMSHKASGRSSNGIDLSVTHDMGKLFGSRITWQLLGGMSINDISGKKSDDNVDTIMYTTTDYYSTFGVMPPDAPYSSPGTPVTQNVLDATGNPVLNADGTNQTTTVDNSTLISGTPVARATTTSTNVPTVVQWKVHGAYYTFRAGPALFIPIGSRFHASVSLGAALIYAGSTYTVTQTLTPPTGADIPEVDSSNAYKLVPGYFADASLQFDLTERTGFYAGAVFQSASSYHQSLNTVTAQYATKIDLSNQDGFTAGMSYRF